MTREEIKNTPELVGFMLDKCVLADSRTKVRKRLEEVCDLAIKALEQTTWITVSERLPEENRTVIASTEYGVYPEARYTEEDGWQWAYEPGADYWVGLKNVTAWMPLPEPYKCNNSEKYLNYADQDAMMPAT